MTKKERDALIKAETKKALDDFKATIPGYAPPSGGGRSPGGRLTLAQIDAMPMSEWQSYSREDRTRMLEDAHRMTG